METFKCLFASEFIMNIYVDVATVYSYTLKIYEWTKQLISPLTYPLGIKDEIKSHQKNCHKNKYRKSIGKLHFDC